MTDRLDLLKIAQEEQSGDLFKYLDSVLKRSSIKPKGYPDAIIWEGGNPAGGVKPVAHALTTAMFGPRAPVAIAMWPLIASSMKFATRNGVIRRGPFSSSTFWFSTIMSTPPPPELNMTATSSALPS